MHFLIGTIVLIVLACLWSKWLERRHFASIREREETFSGIFKTAERTPPDSATGDAQLVTGAVVIASDYFKSFAASIRSIFGGEVHSLERMAERGRREAILRMLAEANAAGANAVYNIRIETSTIAGKRTGSCAGVEVLAFGTAITTAGA